MHAKRTIGIIALMICVTVILFSTPSNGSEIDTEQKEFQKMSGTWKYITYEQDGKSNPRLEDMPNITFKNEHFTIHRKGKTFQKGINTIYPDRNPRLVNAKVTDGVQKGSVLLGIYEIDGDIMRVCFGRPEKGRPKDFSVPKGSGYFLVTLKRIEPTIPAEMSEGETLVRKLFSDLKARRLSDVEDMLAKGFQSVHQDGVRTKAEEITLLKDLNIGEYILDNFQTTLAGNNDILVVTYTVSVQETNDGKKAMTKPSPRLTVFHKNGQGWKWLAHANLTQSEGTIK